MTIRELLDYCAPFYPTWDRGVRGGPAQAARPARSTGKIKAFSRGMRMKAALLSSLAYRPTLLVLDEPFAGLDALVRDEFIQGILELAEEAQWSVFISSHDIDEVERLADWIGVINEGRLYLAEPVASLVGALPEDRGDVRERRRRRPPQAAASPRAGWRRKSTGHTLRVDRHAGPASPAAKNGCGRRCAAPRGWKCRRCR